MKTHQLSRRRWLCGLLAALTAGLRPRPRRAAAPRHHGPPLAPPPAQFAHRCTYSYDARGRLLGVTEDPPRPAELVRCTHVTNEHGVTSHYYFG